MDEFIWYEKDLHNCLTKHMEGFGSKNIVSKIDGKCDLVALYRWFTV